VADTLSQLFADAGNILRPTARGFKCGHEPVHKSTSSECVHIDPTKGKWFCHSCQQGGDVVAAVMSLRSVSRAEAEDYLHPHGDLDSGESSSKKTQAELLIEAAADAAFFHDEQSDPWAIVPVGTHHETLRLRDRSFKRWLVRNLYTATGKTPNAEALSQALLHLESRALFDGLQRPLAYRLATQADSIVYDLADADWRCVTITAQGWKLGQRPGMFRRGSNTAPQVVPRPGGKVADVLDFLPPMSEPDQLLLQVYLITCLVPDMPHPIPVISGQKGAAKSTLIPRPAPPGRPRARRAAVAAQRSQRTRVAARTQLSASLR
jgi:hypothetical protein